MTQVRDSRRRAAATSRRASSRIWSRSTCRQLMQIPKSGTRARAPARARERRCLAIREVKLNKIIRGNRIPFSPQKPNRSSTTTSTSTIPPHAGIRRSSRRDGPGGVTASRVPATSKIWSTIPGRAMTSRGSVSSDLNSTLASIRIVDISKFRSQNSGVQGTLETSSLRGDSEFCLLNSVSL
jgi:hypothetical protein